MLKIVVDTNLWIRVLLGGKVTLSVLQAWQANRFELIISQPLLDELEQVCQRPRLQKRIPPEYVQILLEQMQWRGRMVELTTIPPRCRDPKDHPVLATAIDGQADAIVRGDADLRADAQLREEMAGYGVHLWGVITLLSKLADN